MNPARKLRIFSVGLYLTVCAGLIACTLVKTQGHLVYALDDAYIHLALAENLAHGHYGLNPTEFSSPSSSILWPYMLVPFAGTRLHDLVPLAWNLLFGALAAYVIASIVARWPLGRRSDQRNPAPQQYAAAALLILTANLASLTMIGMEHVLQVLLAISCAHGVIEALHQRPIPNWSIAAAAVAPMVRYEDLSLTLAVACALVGTKRWKAGLGLFAVSILPLVAFSALLRHDGMPILPMSVLAKGHDFANTGAAGRIAYMLLFNPKQDIIHPDHWSTVALFLCLLALTIRSKTARDRWAFGGAAALGLLQLTIGRFGWFHRYEVYALIFMLLICADAAIERFRVRPIYILGALALCASVYLAATIVTPSSSDGIYLQQFQMHRFVADFYDGDYAVNDLGLVSFQRRPGAYVLDLQGLASTEASSQVVKTAPWLENILKRHGIDLAIVYPSWFRIPPVWTPIGQLCITTTEYVHNSSPCVVFYSANPRSTQTIRADLSRFQATLPRNAVYTAF
jgi:hypothetical protein